jgi:hypothetical protein
MGAASGATTGHSSSAANTAAHSATSESAVVRLNASSTRQLSAELAGRSLKYGVQNKSVLGIMDAQAMARARERLLNPDSYVAVAEVNADGVGPDGTIVFNDSKDLVANQFYSYTVVAEDVDGWRSASTGALMASPFRVKAEPVRNLKTIMHASQRGVVLYWDPPAVAAPHKIVGYFVKRARAGSTNFMQISEQIHEPKWADFGVLRGPNYTYQVYSLDEVGNLSNPVSIDFAMPQ